MSVAEGTSKLKFLVIAGPPASPVIGIGRVAETIAPLLPLMRPAELRRVLRIEDEPATAQRLGFVLENLKATNLAKVVQDWLPSD